MLRTIRIFLTILFSAGLLVVAFPQIEWWQLAWVAFVPLFFVLDGQGPWVSFRRAYMCGFLFFFGTVGWFVYVTYPGAILLISYLSLYFGIFGLAFNYFKPLNVVYRILALAGVWVVLEFIRAHLLTGFGWVFLGHSQLKNTLLVQIVDITGVYGVSFLVMLVNLLVYESIVFTARRSQLVSAHILVIVLLLISLSYGFWTVTRPHAWSTVKVSVVQPNIPQEIKWDTRLQSWIVQKTIRLSHNAAKDNPELIIWPETSLPGIMQEVFALKASIEQSAKEMQTPLLMGAVDQREERFYNTAFLIGREGKIIGYYDKFHLVPFGEYLPLRPLLGWVNTFVPLEDFTSGDQHKVFELACPQKTFSVLICFEDTVSSLRRSFAKAGARFFVNMTNDAWFKDTKAPYLHMQAGAFGAIENRRSLVRAANTGVSCVIDPFGRMIAAVEDSKGKKGFVTGVATAQVPLNSQLSFYTKYGDLFTFLALLGILMLVWKMKGKKKDA